MRQLIQPHHTPAVSFSTCKKKLKNGTIYIPTLIFFMCLCCLHSKIFCFLGCGLVGVFWIREMGERRREALAVCGDKSMATGISVLDVDSGDALLHIPSCASPPGGLICFRDQFLVASQISRHGSVGGGSIITWALNKPQSPLRSYTMEAIGPLACTKNGTYLAGGAPSGNAYIWEVTNGKLLKSWPAHHKPLSCMLFADDDSLLISGSDDGMICVWSMVSLLDTEDSGNTTSLLHFSLEHQSSVTGLISVSRSMSSIFVSSSVDGTCKVWDLVSGRLIQTQDYPIAITTIALHPLERLLFCGSSDGRIFLNGLDIGLVEDPCVVAEYQSVVMKGHKGPITALTFSGLDLLSASEDGTICLWNVSTQTIIRRFNQQKGTVTNLVVIPHSLLPSVTNHQRVSRHSCVSLLDKYPHSANSKTGTVTIPPCCSLQENRPTIDFKSSNSLRQQIRDLEQERTAAAMEMKVGTSLQNRLWATKMTKHVMEMNNNLQSRLLDMMQYRLLQPAEKVTLPMKRKQCEASKGMEKPEQLLL